MEIKLTQGKVALVDDKDYEQLNQWKWHYDRYAIRAEYVGKIDGKEKNRKILMHRLIMDTPEGMHTDHINGNKLDNRRGNLRVCTNAQNQQNRKTVSGKSKYKGVSWRGGGYNRWFAMIKVDREPKCLGYFDTEEQAAIAYNEAAQEYFGEFANLNCIAVLKALDG